MKNKYKRISALLMCLVLIFTVGAFSVSADEAEDFFASILGEESATEEEHEAVVPESAEQALQNAQQSGQVLSVENDTIRLQLDKSNGYLYVTDKLSGKLWTSNPYDAESDELASGITRTNLRSQIIVTYIKGKALTSINNYSASIGNDGAEYEVNGDTIRAEYSFPNEKIFVPIEYCLTDTGFEAKVIFEEITDTKDIRVNKIAVLPYFGAAGQNDTGYMLIPDGSGALVNLNNPMVDSFPYEKAYYGGNKGKTPNILTTVDKSLMLPVYGMKNGDNAFVATITSGAETASLYACVAGVQASYNRIYTEAVYRTYDTVNLKDAIGKKVYAKYAALDAVKLPEYCVSYTLLSGDDADYVGMAAAVRRHLNEAGLQQTDNGKAELFVDLYGATLKEKAFMGIRYTGVQKLTTIKEAKQILEALKEQGIGAISVGYRNFSESEYEGALASKVVPAKKLGGKAAYKDLLSYSKENGVNIYPYADFVSFKKNGNGYWHFSDVILGLELSMVKRYGYTISDGQPDKTKSPQYLISADRYGKAKNQILKTTKKYNSTGVLFDESVNYVYNDFASGGYQSDRTVDAMKDIYGELKGQGQKIMMSAPNAYALPFASVLTDMPMDSSQYVFFDSEIPFLQIVLKGQIKYSSTALNIDGTSDTTLLKLIETGSQPKFAMIYSEGSKLLGTELTNLYGATHTACIDDAVADYKALADLCDKTAGSAIIGHIEQNELVTVTYENGVTVYVNYAKAAQTLPSGETVSALSYLIKG